MASNVATLPMEISANLSFPEGILQSAKCLIALTGLDTRNNAVHMAIWDIFKAARRGDRKPVKYTTVSADHPYPRKKERVITDDSGSAPPSPLGILKLNWVHKHTNEVPAVVVFFFDLDWTHPQWDAKVIECASKVRVIRSSLNGHSTDICVALIQSVKPSPSGTDMTVSEKAAQLCMACELPTPNLFVMPYVDRPEGYVNRLETTFYEMALRYYSNQCKMIRILRDGNRLLAIRRMFKLSFFTEYKQDYRDALKHYISTYKYITDVMIMNEQRIMEFKMMCGFINYKVCKIMFELDDARNAIIQFNKFVETFRKEKGPSELLFQHMEWMSNQYSAFADLFGEAVRRGLKPSQLQHPGVHYYQAIQHQLTRRKLKETLCREAYDSLPRPLPQTYTELPIVEFIGERQWRVGLSDNQPSSSKLKEKVITVLQAHEYTVKTSDEVTVLLSNALHHFKELEYKSDHMINHLKVLLSEEYFLIGDYKKCITLLQVAINNYRVKRWWKILSDVLQTMLKCSYELGLVTSYVTVCMELISTFIPSLFKGRSRIQDNLHLVLNGNVPVPEPGTDESRIQSINESWRREFESLKNEDEDIDENGNMIVMSKLASCVECKSWFVEHTFTSDSLLKLEIYLRSNCPQQLQLSGLCVTFDHNECDKWCILNEDIVLEPGKYRKFVFEFPTTSETLQVLTVEANVGLFKLVWREGVSRFGLETQDWAWNRIQTRTSTLILQRDAQISLFIRHRPPILYTEIYPVTMSITNNEEREITKIIILAVLLQDHEHTMYSSQRDNAGPMIRLYSSYPSPSSYPLQPTSPNTDSHYCIEAECPSLLPGEKFESTFYIKSYSVGAHKLNINCSYKVDCFVGEKFGVVQCKCDKEENITMETVTPLRVSHKILNNQFQLQNYVFLNEPFILQTNISSVAPWSVKITDIDYELNSSIAMDTFLPKQLANTVLSQQDMGTELHQIIISPEAAGTMTHFNLGVFKMKWRRNECECEREIEPALASVNLPQVTVKELPYSLSVDVPAYAVQNDPFTLTYKIHNRTIFVQSYDSIFPSSSDFVYSGNRVSTFRVLPNSTHTLSFNLLPLNVGHVHLPKLEVTCTTHPKLDEQATRGVCANLPNSIFVVPSASGANSEPFHNTTSLTAAVIL